MYSIKVSVIVPVFNCEKYLSSCIASLLQQTYSPLEIILVDDGSSDSSGHICDQFSDQCGRIRVLHKKNEGAAAARRDGILLASGTHLVFVDADDYVEPDYVEALMQYASQADLVIGTFRCFTEEIIQPERKSRFSGYYDRKLLEQEVFPQMLSATPFYTFGVAPSMCGKLIKKDHALKNIGALETGITIGEDGCFTYAVLLDCQSVYFMGYCGYCYRKYGVSTSDQFREKELRDTKKLRDFYKKLEAEKDWDSQNQIEEYIARMCVRTTMAAVQTSFLQSSMEKKLAVYIDENFPECIWGNSKFQNSTWVNRALYLLVRCHAFFALKLYIEICKYRKRR